jgi:FixJ family two-component response regulator
MTDATFISWPAQKIGSMKLDQVTLVSIVDDDESVREAMKSLVRSFGYSVETFGSAAEFLESAQVENTDCLVTDVQMPGLSGVELQNRLLSEGYHMPTIFISAFPNSQIEEWVVQRGAIAYLRKPFNEDELFEHLQTAVKRGRG